LLNRRDAQQRAAASSGRFFAAHGAQRWRLSVKNYGNEPREGIKNKRRRKKRKN
jgi:hypothetical protein